MTDAIDMDADTYAEDPQRVSLDGKTSAHAADVAIVADSRMLVANGVRRVLGPVDYDDALIRASGIVKDMVTQFERKRIQTEVVVGVTQW
ncbi:MAG: hypothetical protein GXY19_11820 [Phycisphaerae bacterium]|nr:hypothetical protein [Phycisphaerae bacterium]